MRYGVIGRFIWAAFSKTAFSYMRETAPDMDIADYKNHVMSRERAEELGFEKSENAR